MCLKDILWILMGGWSPTSSCDRAHDHEPLGCTLQLFTLCFQLGLAPGACHFTPWNSTSSTARAREGGENDRAHGDGRFLAWGARPELRPRLSRPHSSAEWTSEVQSPDTWLHRALPVWHPCHPYQLWWWHGGGSQPSVQRDGIREGRGCSESQLRGGCQWPVDELRLHAFRSSCHQQSQKFVPFLHRVLCNSRWHFCSSTHINGMFTSF